jgi:hypothetical protein
MLTSFEAAELASVIRPSGTASERATLIRRIRHWTLAGALKPVGNVHGGTGKHRRYAAQEGYIAAILDVLANRSLPIGTLKAVAKEVRKKPWQDYATNRESSVFLRLDKCRVSLVKASDLGQLIQDAKCIIAVNLSQVSARLIFCHSKR